MPNSLLIRWLSFVIFVCTLLSNSDLPADIVVNGDFETGDRSGWTWNPQPSAADAVVSYDVFGSDGPSFAFQVIPTTGFSALSQVVSLDAGTEYTVSWEQAMQNIGVDAIQSAGRIEVRLGGQVLSQWNQGFLGASSSTGLQESKLFTPAADDSYELTFLFQRQPSATVAMYIDNVSIVSAVPEPSSFATFGLILVGMFKRRRRKTPLNLTHLT